MKFIRKQVDELKKPFLMGGKLELLYPAFNAFETMLFVPDHTTSKGSHIRDGVDLKRTMITVIIALMPALFYGMYLLSWRILEDKEKIIKITSIIAIVGAVNIPIIKFSVDWWSTLHQSSSVKILSTTTIHTSMLIPLAIMTAAFTLFSILIFLMKYNTELIKIKNKGLDRL